MKIVIAFIALSFGLQVFGTPLGGNVKFIAVEMRKTFSDKIASMGAISTTISPAVDRAFDTFTRTQYMINVSLDTMNQVFEGAINETNADLDSLRKTVGEIIKADISNVQTRLMYFMDSAKEKQQKLQFVDVPLGRILKAAVEESTKCIRDLGETVATNLITRVASIAKIAQEGGNLSTYAHLLDNEIDMLMHRALETAQYCNEAYANSCKESLRNVQPEQPFVLPPNIGAAGSNLEGVERINREGVEYVKSLVPDLLISALKPFNLDGVLMPTLERAVKSISDERFEMSKALFNFKTELNFSLTNSGELGSGFDALNQRLSNSIQGPIVEMIARYIPRLLSVAGPIIMSTPDSFKGQVVTKIASIMERAIDDATVCITDVPYFTTRAVASGKDVSKVAMKRGGVLVSKIIMPGVYNNIQSINSQVVEQVPICMQPHAYKAITSLVDVQKRIYAAASTPITVQLAQVQP